MKSMNEINDAGDLSMRQANLERAHVSRGTKDAYKKVLMSKWEVIKKLKYKKCRGGLEAYNKDKKRAA